MRTLEMVLTGMLVSAVGIAAESDDLGGLPDPTRPYEYRQPVEISTALPQKAAEWRLYGIQIRGDARRAIINGRLVKEGDTMGTATVVAISSTEVTLEQDRRKIVLRLLNPDIKHAVADTETKSEPDRH